MTGPLFRSWSRRAPLPRPVRTRKRLRDVRGSRATAASHGRHTCTCTRAAHYNVVGCTAPRALCWLRRRNGRGSRHTGRRRHTKTRTLPVSSHDETITYVDRLDFITKFHVDFSPVKTIPAHHELLHYARQTQSLHSDFTFGHTTITPIIPCRPRFRGLGVPNFSDVAFTRLRIWRNLLPHCSFRLSSRSSRLWILYVQWKRCVTSSISYFDRPSLRRSRFLLLNLFLRLVTVIKLPFFYSHQFHRRLRHQWYNSFWYNRITIDTVTFIALMFLTEAGKTYDTHTSTIFLRARSIAGR